MREALSPHKVSLTFLLQWCVEESPDNSHHALVTFLLGELRDVEDCGECSLPTLVAKLSSLGPNGFVLAERLVERLRRIDSPEDVFEVMESVQVLVEGGMERTCAALARHSAFGVFARQNLVIFRSLGFDGVCRLFNDIVQYVDAEQGETFSGSLLHHQLEGYVRQEAQGIEQSVGVVAPADVEKRIRQLLRMDPDNVKAHYLRFLNCLHAREHEGAVESLHRYFDLCTAQPASIPSNLLPPTPGMAMTQYAVLTLAGLHARFGHVDEALQAIDETVRIAQQTNDHPCLVQALAWLFRLTSTLGDVPQEQRLLSRFVARARELNMPYFSALGSLALARFNVYHQPRSAIHSFPSVPDTIILPSAVLRSLCDAQSISASNALDGLIGTTHLMRSCCWDFFGSQALSAIFCRLQLRHYADASSPEDTCLAFSRLALALFSQSSFRDALDVILDARKRFPSPAQNVWPQIAVHLLFHRSLYRDERRRYHALGNQLVALSPPQMDFGVHVEARFQWAWGLVHSGRLEEACRHVLDVIPLAHTRGLYLQAVSYLLLLAEMHIRALNPVGSLPFVLRCLTLCEQYNLDTVAAIATTTLAHARLMLGEAERAILLINGVMPHVLANCSRAIQASAFVTLASASLLSLSQQKKKKKEEEEQEQRQVLCDVLIKLEAARSRFEQVEAVSSLQETTYLMACIHHRLGNVHERNKAAHTFRQLHVQRGRAARLDPGGLFSLRDQDILHEVGSDPSIHSISHDLVT